MARAQKLIRSLGPGLLFASSAIGVSHLVQSTRAGAEYGYSLLWAILIANILKYPFFEFGSRYAVYSGNSLLKGYRDIGKWSLWVYLLMTLVSMFTVTAAVSYITAGLLNNLLGVTFGIDIMALVIFAICVLILFKGSFNILNKIIQVLALLLVVSTLTCFVVLIFSPLDGAESIANKPFEVFGNEAGVTFLIALMGWMPTAVDLSVWNSLWTVEKMKEDPNIEPRSVLREFNFGYWLSAVLSVIFMLMGAWVLYGSGDEFAPNALSFANQLIGIYTSSLGQWSYLIIAIASFSIMFSTTLAVFDGYSRVLSGVSDLLFPRARKVHHIVWLLVIALGAYLIISVYLHHMKGLVNLATITSFIIAPAIALLNFRLIRKVYAESEMLIGKALPRILYWLAILGILYLLIFTIYYLVVLGN